MDRRRVLQAGLTLPLASWWVAGQASPPPRGTGAGTAFGSETVADLARALASRPYQRPDTVLRGGLEKIDYDQYRDIRFDPAHALWRGEALPFQAQFFHRGFLFRERVDLHVVRDGRAVPVVYDPAMFDFEGEAVAPTARDLGFAGFRLHAPINRPDYFDEVCTFLGASYFRAVGKGQAYGLSARGLALGTGRAEPEEFPVFKSFWLERPVAGADQMVVHALMDSASAAAAFRFAIRPGAETVFDVALRLYPRVELADAGIAPLTSMFEFDAGDRVGVDDYRPAVHDSDGLAMLNGRGEQIWRPLRNPAAVRTSAFQDENPRGFGLMQRKRDFADYQDLEAHYQDRPSLWVEPRGDWGDGEVRLVEIPTADEYHDNIVAFWHPRQPLAAGREHRFEYRLHWCGRPAWKPGLATVTHTRIGAAMETGVQLVVIDLAGGRLRDLPPDAKPDPGVYASGRGQVRNAVAYPNPAGGGWRIGFELLPDAGAGDIELRAQLHDRDGPLSETWLYRWSA